MTFALSVVLLGRWVSLITAAMGEESYLINTFSFVDEQNQFAGSSCPGMNSSMSVDAAFLASRVRGVISLNDAFLDWSPLIATGIKHLHVEVADYRPPTIQQMQTIVAFIESLGSDAPVLIHCNAGMGRTGTVLASLLVWRDRLTAKEAIKGVRSLRRGSVQTFKQEDGVTAWEDWLSST